MCKNANIKTLKDFITRTVVDSETFYLGGSSVYFDPYEGFVIAGEDCKQQFALELGYIKNLQIKTDWRDNLSEENPVLCWVWDREHNNFDHLGLVHKYRHNLEYAYVAKFLGQYKNAQPMTKEEIMKYIVED